MSDSYIIFKTALEVQEWVEKYYTAEELSLLDVNGKADLSLVFYKGNFSRAYNIALRTEKADTEFCKNIQMLQELLCKYEIPTDITTYRFVSWKELKALDRGTRFCKTYEYKSFLSTTLLKDKYAMYDICRNRFSIMIQVPRGTKGAYLPEVNKNRPEYEVLFPYGMRLKKIGYCEYRIVNQ